MTHHERPQRTGRQIRRERRKEDIRRDLERYGSDILNSAEMKKALQQTHHTRCTVGEHSQRVAERSLAICHALERLHIRTDIPAVVTGALCHDLGLLGREEKYASGMECERRHAADSVEVAEKLTGELTEKTRDIIEHHMWPTGRSRPPRSLEGVVISTADKIAAFEDFFRGSEVKQIGFRETMKNIVKQEKGRIPWKTKKK